MKLNSREQDGIIILEPKGKIMGGPDATLLHESLYEFLQQDKKKIVIDLARIEWMNSTGLGILIQGYTTLKNSNGQLKLACVTDKIKSLLTITKLVSVFDSYDTVEDAVESFS
ncbi:MAG: STAS domain-containing protein [candidate division Zixibacteria bacterium]|nr:STAS domain-containing protein [candidate division Zixibacteria bacterium]